MLDCAQFFTSRRIAHDRAGKVSLDSQKDTNVALLQRTLGFFHVKCLPVAPAKANESNEAEESVAQVVFACLQHGSNMIKSYQIEVSSGGN